MERFRIDDWKKNVSDKLGHLASISELFSSEVNEKRNQLLEIIIIILITIEVVPYVYEVYLKFFA